MEPILIICLSCTLLGLVVGTLAGMLGIGGGLITVPVLVFLLTHFLAVPVSSAMPIAIATSLATIMFTSFSSARAHYQLGNVNLSVTLWCGVGIALGATLGAHFASWIPGILLKRIFAVLVVLIALQMVFGKKKKSQYSASKSVLSLIGVIVGFISSIMGIGGGALLIPALVWFRIDMRQAIGCAAICGVAVAFFGSMNFVISGWSLDGLPPYSLGYVFVPATLSIAITSVITAGMGARMGQKMNTDLLKKILAGLLVLISIRMIVGMD